MIKFIKKLFKIEDIEKTSNRDKIFKRYNINNYTINKRVKISDLSIIELIDFAANVEMLNLILDDYFNNPEMKHLRRDEYVFYNKAALVTGAKPYGYRIGENMAEFDFFLELKGNIINTFFKSELRDQKINQLLK